MPLLQNKWHPYHLQHFSCGGGKIKHHIIDYFFIHYLPFIKSAAKVLLFCDIRKKNFILFGKKMPER